MKKLFIAASALVVMGLMQSCSKDFLDKTPVSDALPHQVFVTRADAEALLIGAYDAFYDEYYTFDFQTMGDAIADNAYAGGDNPANFQLDKFQTSPINGNVERDWRYLYSNINRANIVIDNVPNIPDTALDRDGRRDQIIAEARAIRAYHYFNLVRLWGAVPLVLTQPKSLGEMQPERAPVEDVYAQIIADLEFALTHVRPNSADRFVVTKGVVNALLAKVYASLPTPDWNKVNQYADAVIAGGYQLVDDYNSLFEITNENNSEAIWEIRYDGWSTHGNWLIFVIKGGGWKKFNTPANDLVKAFEDEGDDIRLNASVMYEDQSNEAWTDDYWDKSKYPFINKTRDWDGRSDFYIIRLADILLLKAEALNELGDVNGAAEYVNMVRNRVDLEDTPAATKEDMKLAIEKERRLELAFEGHRWFDLLRTGRAIQVMNNAKDGDGNTLYNITEDDLLLPIPQSERDRNPNATQNDGY